MSTSLDCGRLTGHSVNEDMCLVHRCLWDLMELGDTGLAAICEFPSEHFSRHHPSVSGNLLTCTFGTVYCLFLG